MEKVRGTPGTQGKLLPLYTGSRDTTLVKTITKRKERRPVAKTRERVAERGVMMSQTMWRNLKILAAKKDQTASALIRQAVQDLLDQARDSESQ